MSGKACDACPYLVNAPRSVEGQAAAAIVMHPASWARAGMAGVEMGLDLASIGHRIEEGVDAHAVRFLLLQPAPPGEGDVRRTLSPEVAALEAMAERRKDRKGDEDGGDK